MILPTIRLNSLTLTSFLLSVSYSMTSISSSRGIFILFEGIDRCGKSTQVKLLTDNLNLNGNRTEAIRFPNRESNIGQLINSYLSSSSNLNDQTIHLLFSANRWESSKDIENKLNSGINLVCDRYAYSGVAFTSAKGLDFDWCMNCDIGLPAPDCIIYFDMPVENATKRGNYGDERYEKLEFQRIVQQQFLALKKHDEDLKQSGQYNDETEPPLWAIINAEKSIEEIQNEVYNIVTDVVQRVSNKPVRSLWKRSLLK